MNRKPHTERFSWALLFVALFLLGCICYLVSLFVSKTYAMQAESALALAGGVLIGLAVAAAVFAVLHLLSGIAVLLKSNSEKAENAVDIVSRQNNLLTQIAQAARLSDTAKEVVFRDTEQIELGEAILNKLHQHDFDSSVSMIAALAESPKYAALAARLKLMAERYRSATEEGRINQVIAHIEGLFDQKLWVQASAHIENLIKTFPHSDKARAMPARLQQRKDLQKRQLLVDWDLAVREKNTDGSLEILKELDLYLTPNEALAYRESASSVFRTKLHNLGVAFSFAVTEQDWKKAYETGRQIVQDFPNSRMAAEIRSRMDILAERAKQKKPAKS